jgi:Fe-S-cluster containining protein
MMQSDAAAPYTGWSVRCAACGSCCNSAPVLSLLELFSYQHRFVGTLGMRRVRRVRTGDALGRGRTSCRASEEDRAAFERISADCLHPFPAEGGSGYDLLLTPLGFDDPDLGRCPALGEDGRCTLHGQHKPAVCSAIPLDPLLPDRLQHMVLAERWAESDELGGRCIARVTDPDRMTVQGWHVMAADARQALADGRRALAADKRLWGTAIFAQIAKQLVAEPGNAERIPSEGFLVIPLTPVLELLAGVSDRCRQRCLDYLDAQIVLCEITEEACLARKQSSVGATLARLRSFLRSNHVLRNVLVSRRSENVALPGVAADEIETWLEHTQAQATSMSRGVPAT